MSKDDIIKVALWYMRIYEIVSRIEWVVTILRFPLDSKLYRSSMYCILIQLWNYTNLLLLFKNLCCITYVSLSWSGRGRLYPVVFFATINRNEVKCNLSRIMWIGLFVSCVNRIWYSHVWMNCAMSLMYKRQIVPHNKIFVSRYYEKKSHNFEKISRYYELVISLLKEKILISDMDKWFDEICCQHAKCQNTDWYNASTQSYNSGPNSTSTIPGCNMGFTKLVSTQVGCRQI